MSHRWDGDRMDEVGISELRNYGGQILDRVAGGESMTITRDGTPIARLSPLPTVALSAQALVDRWRGLPRIDVDALRCDFAKILDFDL